MKTIAFTDFRKKASGFINDVEHGETIVLIRHGKPVAEVIPFSNKSGTASWKQPGIRLQIPGADLSSVIIAERWNS